MICDATCAQCVDKPYECTSCADELLYPDVSTKMCGNPAFMIKNCVKYDQIQYVDRVGTNTFQYICTRCKDGYYRTANINALDYEYLCVPCESGVSDGHTRCARCDMRTVYVGTQEREEYYCAACQDGYYAHLGTNHCVSCSSKCLVCLSGTQCAECAQGFALIKQEEAVVCAACAQDCLVCSTAGTCDICAAGFRVENGSCVVIADSSCIVQKSDGKCDLCGVGMYIFDGECRSCAVDQNGLQSHCNRCYGIQNDELTGFQDQLQCADCEIGYYLDQQYQCKQCGDSSQKAFCVDGIVNGISQSQHQCRTIGSGEQICDSCLLDYFITWDGQCRMCPADHINGCTCASNASCSEPDLQPVPNCLYCGNDCACGACRRGYILNDGVCQIECLDGLNIYQNCYYCESDEYLRIDYNDMEEPLRCLKLMPKCVDQELPGECLSCQIPTNELTTCWYPLTNKCASGYYADGAWCKPCGVIRGCKTCSNGTECTVCNDGRVSSVCSVENCAEDEIPCLQCANGYFLADNGMSCVDCKFLTRDALVDGVVNAYASLYDSASCSCTLNCERCGNDGYCLQCKSGYFLNNDATCERCNFFCSSCSELERCHSCIDGFFLDRFKQCQRCFPGCQRCISGDMCVQCARGWFLTADSDYEANKNSAGRLVYRCEKCPAGAVICQSNALGNSGVTELKCADGMYLDAFRCLRCAPQCAKCDNAFFCTECVYQSISGEITQQTLDDLTEELQESGSSAKVPALAQLLATGNVQCALCGRNQAKYELLDHASNTVAYKCDCQEYNMRIFNNCVSVVQCGFIFATILACLIPLAIKIASSAMQSKHHRRAK